MYKVWNKEMITIRKYCGKCKFHHSAQHPRNSLSAKDYNNWCCKFGKVASKSLGQCKLTNGRELLE